MSNVLTRIIETKAAHIAALKQRFPEATLTPQISKRSLYDALNTKKTSFIFECKKASPSKGLIRPNFDPAEIADIYTQHASAISVLTDEEYFQGDMDYIALVKARVSQPVLCKDFFVSNYQITLAAHQGADAILLMLSVLDDQQYQHFADHAARFNLDIITEVSTLEELQRAITLNAKIIGINNRNLRDLTTSLTTTENLAPLINANTMIISESGIYTNEDVRRLSPIVNGFLVGSSLMQQADIDLACRQLIYGNNKVCGLTRTEDIQHVAQAGAVYGGLIFAPKSPRYVTIDQAKALCDFNNKQPQKLQMVGVFVNEAPKLIATIAANLNLSAIQLHGSETDIDISELKKALTTLNMAHIPVWKAVPVDVNSGESPMPPMSAERYVYDSKSSNAFGGTGCQFDWRLSVPKRNGSMLAGGLSPTNVASAIEQGFWGLDMNSGVESAPGIKDEQKLNAAFNAIYPK